MIRENISSILIVLSAIWIFSGALYSLVFDMGRQAVEKNREINNAFELSSNYLDEFYIQNDRYPDKSGYEDWVGQYTLGTISPRRVRVLYGQYPQEVINQFQPAPENSYVLTYMRSDWTEYFASWSKESTLVFDEALYYVGKNKYWNFGFAHVIPSVILFALACFVGRKTN